MLIPILTDLLAPLAERELCSTVRVDGFVAPIGDRRKNTCTSGMYSGKNHRCGFNVEVVASCRGRLVMTGDPMPSERMTPAPGANPAWRDASTAGCTPTVEAAGSPTPATPGPACSSPNGARRGPDLLGMYAREFNELIASQRACVERCIAHLKHWRILAYGYRRMTANFPATLAASPTSRSNRPREPCPIGRP